jgi:hypothetical protein
VDPHVMYDRYPAGIVIISLSQTLLVYFLGAAILWRTGAVWAALYLAFCAWAEFRVMHGHCVHCSYYGQACAFGRGKLSSWLFRKGDPSKFDQLNITWASMLPDLMIPLVPLGVGIWGSVRSFSWPLLGSLVLLVLVAFPLTGYVRSQLACAHCRQRELGCPAQRLFEARPGQG